MAYTAPIVVGLDETPASAAAVRWAAWESQMTSAPLIVAHAYHVMPDGVDRPDAIATMESVARAQATRWFGDALADCSALPWRTHLMVVPGEPAEALADVAHEAGMLVVGSARAPSSDPRPPTSVAARCEAQATCPVVVVPLEQTPDGPVVPVVR